MAKKLYQFGEGILRTHVTWEDLQEKLKEIFGEKAVMGPNKSASSIGDGRGFMSKMCLIDPDWTEETGAPKKFVVKVSSQIAFTEAGEKMKEINPPTPELEKLAEQIFEGLSDSVRRVHNTEVKLYNLINRHEIDIPHAKIFATVSYDEENTEKGFIIMEYIEGALSLNLYDNVSVEDIKQALKGLAALEAASLHSFSEEEVASVVYNPFKELITAMMNPQMVPKMFEDMRTFAGARMGEKIDELERVHLEIMDLEQLSTMGPELGMKPVLVHGDCWSTNILWRKREDGAEGLQLAAIVDFQTAHMGMPASDIFRLLGACLSGKDRHAHWEELTELFYSYLKEYLKGTEMPYSLEQLKENYRRFAPLGGFMLVPMIVPIMQFNNMNPDAETKERIEELVLEKMEAMVDDMLEQHRRSQAGKVAQLPN